MTRLAASGLFVLLSLTPYAAAQKDLHFYGGAVVGGEESTAEYLAGGAIQAGRFYIGADTPHSYGLDVSIGANLSPVATVSLIPVGLIGITSESACAGPDCAGAREYNYGFGAVAAFIPSRFRHPAVRPGGGVSYGIHTGFRYTRNYEAAVTVGIVLSFR